jgi:hypothetical protein
MRPTCITRKEQASALLPKLSNWFAAISCSFDLQYISDLITRTEQTTQSSLDNVQGHVSGCSLHRVVQASFPYPSPCPTMLPTVNGADPAANILWHQQHTVIGYMKSSTYKNGVFNNQVSDNTTLVDAFQILLSSPHTPSTRRPPTSSPGSTTSIVSPACPRKTCRRQYPPPPARRRGIVRCCNVRGGGR